MSDPMLSRLGEQEYLRGELTGEIRHEYVDGGAYAMAGAGEAHNLIAGNIFAKLRDFARGARVGWVEDRMIAMVRFKVGATWLCFGLMLGLSVHAPAVLAKPIALLIGINDYRNVKPLEGAVNDVRALRDVLVGRWGFAPQDIRTMVDGEATHANILRELGALQQRSAPGDFVFVYFSGHGTSALDTGANLPLPYSSGAFVPVDFPEAKKLRELTKANRLGDALIIGRTHLRPVFTLLEKDRKVFVMSDSCFSGNMVRAINKAGAGHFRYVPISLDTDSMMASSPGPVAVSKEPAAESYPYRQLVFLSAASDREPARDIQTSDLISLPTLDGKPHGALTDAVLRVLSGELAADVDGDGKLNYTELHQASMQFMESRNYGHTPQRLPGMADDRMQSASAPVFGKGIPVGGNPPAKPVTQVAVRLAPSLSHLKSTLEGIRGIKVVNASDQAMLEVASSGKGIELRAGSGDTIIELPESNELLARRVAAEVWWRGLVAQAKPGFQVNVETNPATRGNTFVAGEEFVFNVRSSQAASLVILNINPEGYVAVLYPQNDKQSIQHPSSQMLSLPEHEKIEVTPPFGMDQVVVLALPKAPANWYGVNKIKDLAGIDSPRIRGLERLLSEQGGRFAWQALSVRTYPKSNAP